MVRSKAINCDYFERARGDPTPKSCSIQKQHSGMINTPLNGDGADEKVTTGRLLQAKYLRRHVLHLRKKDG